MMIMGGTCARACAFCNVRTGQPVALDADERRSSLLILNARDRTELASAHAPHHVPFHFPGQFVEHKSMRTPRDGHKARDRDPSLPPT